MSSRREPAGGNVYGCPSVVPIHSEEFDARMRAYDERTAKRMGLDAFIFEIQSDLHDEKIRHELCAGIQKKYGLDLYEFACASGMIRGYEFRIAELHKEIRDL